MSHVHWTEIHVHTCKNYVQYTKVCIITWQAVTVQILLTSLLALQCSVGLAKTIDDISERNI